MNDLTQAERREAYINGLHEIADYLKANPSVPDNGGYGDSIQYSVSVWFETETAGVAEVDRVANELGVTASWNDDRSHYKAQREFGPHTYVAVWCRPKSEAGAR